MTKRLLEKHGERIKADKGNGRGAWGRRIFNHELIMFLLSDGWLASSVADAVGCTESCVHRIRRGDFAD